MQITSPVFKNNESLPIKYTCDGSDINPPLTFSEIPENTKSLALILDDPDAPSGDWVHWVLWNITPDTKEIPEDSVPKNAIQGLTSDNTNKWGGPCPPSGTHHYQFKLYALDTMLNLPTFSKKKGLEKAMTAHILDQTILVGLYERK